ncbi:hypothetical protein [Treponema phagedenis]|nr:hypothetical protein [Treponema phagedenis]EFW37416.1 hypothetical protein HMPREF9554_02124 [Treponema phagedenis F0421]
MGMPNPYAIIIDAQINIVQACSSSCQSGENERAFDKYFSPLLF